LADKHLYHNISLIKKKDTQKDKTSWRKLWYWPKIDSQT